MSLRLRANDTLLTTGRKFDTYRIDFTLAAFR
jgi:hypothetical protein